ncbi:MAG: disulfide bond formation protein B [Gammaproteobacteria bacterium]|nr:disulfide bond formation protein B [Gammaproteobacteria bacterium]
MTESSRVGSALGRLFYDRRLGNLAGFFACTGLMAYALFAEHVLGFEPCPLCIFQRVGVIALGITFLIAALQNPLSARGSRVYGVLLLAVSAFPGYSAGRHVYIQSLPFGSVPACGASLDYMMDVLPFVTVLRKVLFGAGECQKIDWSLLGLSMPAWVFISVAALATWAVFVNFRSITLSRE